MHWVCFIRRKARDPEAGPDTAVFRHTILYALCCGVLAVRVSPMSHIRQTLCHVMSIYPLTAKCSLPTFVECYLHISIRKDEEQKTIALITLNDDNRNKMCNV